MTFIVPDSVKTYFEDEKVRASVDALLEKVDGKETFENIERNEARSYNQALLAAAQVRADYVELLFGLWEETFGNALQKEGQALVNKFYGEDNSPGKIWANDSVNSWVYRKGAALEEAVLYDLAVWIWEDSGLKVGLTISKWNENGGEYIDFDVALSEEGLEFWRVETPDDDRAHLSSQVSFSDFVANPDAQLLRFRQAAEVLVRQLSSIA